LRQGFGLLSRTGSTPRPSELQVEIQASWLILSASSKSSNGISIRFPRAPHTLVAQKSAERRARKAIAPVVAVPWRANGVHKFLMAIPLPLQW